MTMTLLATAAIVQLGMIGFVLAVERSLLPALPKAIARRRR